MLVYQRAVSWMRTVEELRKHLRGRVSYSLSDQLVRASTSIALNIAEGSGRWHRAEKQNFYRIARGSLYECVPILELLKATEHITSATFAEHYRELEELSKMLSALINNLETSSR